MGMNVSPPARPDKTTKPRACSMHHLESYHTRTQNTLQSTMTMMESSSNASKPNMSNLPIPLFWAEEKSAVRRFTTWIEALFLVRLLTFVLISSTSGFKEKVYVKDSCNFLNTAMATGLVAMIFWRLLRYLPFTWRSLDYFASRLRHRNQTTEEDSCAIYINSVCRSARRLPSECISYVEPRFGIIRSLILRIRRRVETSSCTEKEDVAYYESVPAFDAATDTETDSEREVLLNRSVAPQNISIERAQIGSNDEAEPKYGFDRDKNT
jgi:hypothetical protein